MDKGADLPEWYYRTVNSMVSERVGFLDSLIIRQKRRLNEIEKQLTDLGVFPDSMDHLIEQQEEQVILEGQHIECKLTVEDLEEKRGSLLNILPDDYFDPPVDVVLK
tara:strand:- start:211 stop:531 length:321 start_codon:yes stop_codon:yes gene_type:complete